MCTLTLLATITAAQAAPAPPAATLCDLIGAAAQSHGLPQNYFARLIWQESRFHPDAVSPAGAQGVAQFMPATAADRLLADPFSSREALFASASYLSELRTTFGNLGLAAAAYNAGPGRLSRWLSGAASLPQETIDYVLAVTGHDVSAWTGASALAWPDETDFSCTRLAEQAGKVSRPVESSSAPAETKEWAVIILGNPRRDKALSEYEIVKASFSKIFGGVKPSVVHRRIAGIQIARYIVEIEHDTRGEADAFCSKLSRAGGSCFVLRTALASQPKTIASQRP